MPGRIPLLRGPCLILLLVLADGQILEWGSASEPDQAPPPAGGP